MKEQQKSSLIRRLIFALSVSFGGLILGLSILTILAYLFFSTPYLDGVVDFIDNLAKEFHNV